MTELVDSRPPITLSIIIPAFNEAQSIENTLRALQLLRRAHCEVILADGGSDDATIELAKPFIDQMLIAAKGRARQMNAGAALAQGRYLLFLHADTLPPQDIGEFLSRLESKQEQSAEELCWGFFPVRLSGKHFLLRCVERMMNWRSRLTSVATGDQCLWLHRELFDRVNGFDEIPLMEDVAISKKLRRIQQPRRWGSPVTTSSRRWEQRGILRTICLMWRLRLAYAMGASPQQLVKQYYP